MPDYRLYLFGAPRLEYLGQPVAIDTRKALAMLAYLLIEELPQSRDTLAALLWPESNQTSARAALRRTLSTLRSSLREDLVDFGREVIAIHLGDDLWCDVTAFRSRLADCHTHAHARDQVCPNCLIHLEEAADLFVADFMAGFGLRDSAEFDDWQFFEADRLKRELTGVLERLVNFHGEQGDFPVAIEYAQRWLALDRLNESAHRALICLYAQSGQRNVALRQYRECVRILDQELGVPPLAETTLLYEAVKENRLEKSVFSEQLPVFSRLPRSQTNQLNTESDSLIGRANEWEQLTRLYEGIRQDGMFAALTGELGIGKTRLAQDFITDLKSRGAVTLTTRCYAGESNLAYTPLIDLLRQGINLASGRTWQQLNPRWLNEVARLVPELSDFYPDLPPLLSMDGPGAQNRFYESICQALGALVGGSTPGLIFIDNLEWADESTLDLLAYLVRRLRGRPVCLLAAWNWDASQQATVFLEQILNDAVRQGYGIHLPLETLLPQQALELIERYEPTDRPFPPAFKTRLVAETEGLPYFLVEYLQAGLGGEIRTALNTGHWPLPAGLRGMLQTRLASLSGSALQILQAAAIIGRNFDSDLLQIISGRTEEEIIQGIEELLARGLIREMPVKTATHRVGAIFDFKHDAVLGLVLEETSLVRTRLLHRRTAEALAEQARFDPQSSLNGQIAFHYQKAGLPEQAAESYFWTGQAARKIHANADALVHFQTALALGYPQKPAVLVELGDLYALQGDYPQAIQQYEAAAALNIPALLPLIEQKIGQVYLRRGGWEQAACHFEAALYELDALPPDRRKAFEAEIRADWSLAYQHAGRGEQAATLAQEALSLAESSSDPLALAQAHNLLGVLARANQQPERALMHLSESLGYARQLANPAAQIAALNNLALAQADLGEFPQAIATLQGALSECLILGDRHLEAALHNNLADQLRADGQDELAMLQLKQAVAIFAEIGQQTEEWEPEIWKLVEW